MSGNGKYQIAVAQSNYLYISTDYGNTWKRIIIAGTSPNCAISSNGKYLILQTTQSMLVSSDYGNTWTSKIGAYYWSGASIS